MAGWLAGGVVLGGTWLSVYAAQSAQAGPAALGKDPGTVELVPASGPTSSKPTWATTVACPSGYQGSGLFSEVNADGTYDSIAPVVNGTNSPFKGTLQGSIAQIKALGNIPNGGSQELFVICASQQSATGNTINYMSIYITYSANGASYSTSATKPSSSGSGAPSASSASPAVSPGSGAGTSAGAGGAASSAGAQATSPTSAAPSPSAMDSSFAVTG